MSANKSKSKSESKSEGKSNNESESVEKKRLREGREYLRGKITILLTTCLTGLD